MTTTVQLFITCLVDTFTPSVGMAVLRLLNHLGIEVAFPIRQTCCGQPAYNAGLPDQARSLARHTIQVFEATRGAVVLPSGSCTAMITHGYRELFSQDPDWQSRAQLLANRTYEFSQFLVDVLGVTDIGARFSGRIAYHPSCHLLRELDVDRQPKSLLRSVQQVDLVELPDAEECCGFGGVFAVEHPEISSAMLARKIRAVEKSGADCLVACDTGCLLHIEGGLRKQNCPQRALHLAEVLATNIPG